MATAPTAALSRRLQEVRATAASMEQLLVAGSVNEIDVQRVYEGLYLRAITGLESYLEETFCAIVLGRIQYPSSRDVRPRLSITTRVILDDVVVSGRPYVDWLPYERTLERANAFLRGGRPFTELPTGRKTDLRKWLITRHAIAHAGNSAQRKFEAKVLNGVPLPQSQRNPVGYLRSQARINPPTTQFELFLEGIAQLTTEIDP